MVQDFGSKFAFSICSILDCIFKSCFSWVERVPFSCLKKNIHKKGPLNIYDLITDLSLLLSALQVHHTGMSTLLSSFCSSSKSSSSGLSWNSTFFEDLLSFLWSWPPLFFLPPKKSSYLKTLSLEFRRTENNSFLEYKKHLAHQHVCAITCKDMHANISRF